MGYCFHFEMDIGLNISLAFIPDMVASLMFA